MPEQDLFYLMALQSVEGVGDIIAKKLLLQCGTAEAVFKIKSTQLALVDGVGAALLKNIRNKSVFEKAQKELDFIRSNDINVTFFLEENYPDRLKHCIDAPVLLFSSGNIDLKEKKSEVS